MDDNTAATLTLDGLTVEVTLRPTEHGPVLDLRGKNCNLEGEEPGLYYLTPLVHAAIS